MDNFENDNEKDNIGEQSGEINSSKEIEKNEKNDKFNIQSKFHQFLKELKSNMCKCRYRKVLDDIINTEDFFSSVEDGWKINELKIKCMLKILYRKILKHEGSMNNINYGKSIDTWFTRVDSAIDEWISFLPEKDEIQVETLIQLLLEELYLNALYSKIEMNYQEAACFLALADKIIKEFIPYSRDCKAINIAQKILLFQSSLLIADNDFINAKVCQTRTIQLCYREIFIRVDLSEGVNYTKISKHPQYALDKIFLNMIIAFYQKGVCEENLGNIIKAVECYKQSKWFATKFIREKIPDLVQFIYDLEKRALNYNHIIRDLKQKSEDVEKSFMVSDVENSKNSEFLIKKEKLSSIAEGRTINLNNYDEALKILEKLKFPEFEFNNNKKNGENNYKEYILSTIHLINNLMDDGFKDILKEMKDLKINHINDDIYNKFQKRINELRVEKNLINRQNQFKISPDMESKDLSSSLKNWFRPKTAMFNNDLVSNEKKIINCANNFRKSCSASTGLTNLNNASLYRSESVTNINNCNNVDSYVSIKVPINNNQQSSVKPYCSYKPGAIEKLNHDKFTLSKSFRNKIDYLKKVNEKEINFHKKLLYLKRHELIDVPEVDNYLAREEAEIFFKRKFNLVSIGNFGVSKDKNIDFRKDSARFRDERKKENLQNLVIKSLSSQSVKKLKNFMDVQEKVLAPPIGEFMNKYNEMQCKVLTDRKSVEKKNNEVIKNIDKDLSHMKKENEFYDKILKPLKYHNRSKSASLRSKNF